MRKKVSTKKEKGSAGFIKNKVLVNFILDKSGSMASVKSDTIGGFNTYLKSLKQEAGVDYLFTLTLFDTLFSMPYESAPLAKVEELNEKTYITDGNTALHDAIGKTIHQVSSDMPDVDKIITVIMTDGEENSSHEWKLEGVKKLIAEKEKLGNWTFVFLGASPSAWDQGHSYGISHRNTAVYQPGQTQSVFMASAAATNTASASGQCVTMSFYDDAKHDRHVKAAMATRALSVSPGKTKKKPLDKK
jgi:uncharacterized protein YegL